MDVLNCGSAPVLSVAALRRILGYRAEIPLSAQALAKSLRVAFYPTLSQRRKLAPFLDRLTAGFVAMGVEVMSYEQALAEGANGRIGCGITLIAPGEGEPGDLAIDHVASLSNNTIVGILDGTLPGMIENRFQKRVNAIVGALAWHMVHVVIYIDDISWTVCNMNGAIDTFSLDNVEDRLQQSLIPKLAAPVVPPQQCDYHLEEGALDVNAATYHTAVQDLVAGARAWGENGLMATPVKLNELAFQNPKYRRIAGAYLSWRTGMSYGFLAHQLPLDVRPAMSLEEAPSLLRGLDWSASDFCEIDSDLIVAARLQSSSPWLIRIPEVAVLCTRSGCDKTAIDPHKDIVQLVLRKGGVIVRTAAGLAQSADCQPSFDTSTILAHAVGNAMVASLLDRIKPDSPMANGLKRNGLALAHWHGFIGAWAWPRGYYLHGENNPPVSCSTPQAALFALQGKLAALQQSLKEGVGYLGDIHVEPSHGTNITGLSLADLARLAAAGKHPGA